MQITGLWGMDTKGPMTERKLPQPRQKSGPPTAGKSKLLSVQLRPVVTLTGTALLIGGAIGIFSSGFGLPSLIATSVGAVVLILNQFLKKSITSPVEAAEMIHTQREAKLKELKRQISKSQYLENVGDLGERTAQQLTQISDRFKKFQELLQQKFNPNEITYGRYYSAAERTFLSILDNLNLSAASLGNIDAIDPKYIDEQLKQLSVDASKNAGEINSLNERKLLRKKQIESVMELLAFNEKAITEFDRVSTALSEVKTQRGQSDATLEAAMQELTELANRAKKYSITS